MSGFSVCITHRRFFPCVSHVGPDCRWSTNEDDVWEVSEYILLTTPQQRIAELKALPAAGGGDRE